MRLSIKLLAYFIACIFFRIQLHAASIILHTKNATVWLPYQTIQGEITGESLSQLVVHINDSDFVIKVDSMQTFSFSILFLTMKGMSIL